MPCQSRTWRSGGVGDSGVRVVVVAVVVVVVPESSVRRAPTASAACSHVIRHVVVTLSSILSRYRWIVRGTAHTCSSQVTVTGRGHGH
eukprot:38946-Rhodomonas_salina.1